MMSKKQASNAFDDSDLLDDLLLDSGSTIKATIANPNEAPVKSNVNTTCSTILLLLSPGVSVVAAVEVSVVVAVVVSGDVED